MNKIWIAFMMAFCVAFVGCENKPEVVPDPEIVKLNVLPGTSVTSGDEITVEFEAKNAISTENNIGAPTTTSWVYKTTATLNMTSIEVSAINQAGRKVTATLPLIVTLPYVPTAVDTLCSRFWTIDSFFDSPDNGQNWVEQDIPDEWKKEHIVFYKTGKYDVFKPPYQPENHLGPWDWSIEGRKINFSGLKDFCFTKDKLTSKLILTLTFPGIYVDENGKEHNLISKQIYVGL